ncbi:GPW/gp25 family protein [bacterium]|nr:GPW/gp25 family protein [Hellea sp.]MDA7807171.1 GPW/gp25 family protein [bacterium]MDA9048000.1 GPW/gp25 family protein [Hellea sp.]MDA9225094.1 GPW/gp25 family protein [bacterium]
MANIYKGFSTVGKVRAPYTLIDGDLIKADLLNELYTKRGERLMRPTYGTRIWDILMNPLDQYVIAEIKEDIERIVEKDSRVEMTDIFTEVLDHTIRITLHLKFKPYLSEDTLYVEYAKDNVEI